MARDIEDRVRLPATSEVPGRFEGQHMWQMGSKLEAPRVLYFCSALNLQLYTVIQIKTRKKSTAKLKKSSFVFKTIRFMDNRFSTI